MQLTEFSNSLKPLTLASGLFVASTAFSYSDIDMYNGKSIITNPKTAEYIEKLDAKENTYLLKKFWFQNHLEAWESKTMFLSSVNAIVDDEDFRAIVSMGMDAVPFITEELTRNPSTLVWALNFIFNKKISEKKNLTISDACKLWIKTLS